MRDAVQDLRLRPGLRLVDTPRAASILLVVGEVGDDHRDALARVHDLIPHPRATLPWTSHRLPGPLGELAATDLAGADPEATIRAVFGALMTGQRPSEPAVLPDLDPIPWRGLGPYGQGGTGMTGGTPYGRPLADVGPDRDGLRLDVLPIELGPFFPRLPAGLVLEMMLAGDVLGEVEVASASVGPPRSMGAAARSASPFIRALSEPVPVAELEMARARDHLRWLADALVAQGLPALGQRALRLAHDARPGDGDRVRRFGQSLRRTQLFRWSLPDGTPLDTATIAGAGLGPLARAAGLAEDARLADPVYRALGFEPIILDGHDAGSSWRIRFAEAARSLDLAAAARGWTTEPIGRVESPRGRLEPGDAPTSRTLRLVPGLIAGLAWGDALAMLVALDLDLDEADEATALAAPAVA